MKKRSYFFMITTICILLLSSCGDGGKKTLTKVKLTTSKNMWCALSFIANEKQFFIEEGLDAELIYTEGGRYCMDAIISGSADIGNTVEVNVAYLGYTGNTSISVIGSMVSSTSLAIIAKRSSGINKPEDLNGKKIALSPGTTSDVYAYRFFDKYKININNIDIRPTQPKALQGAILAKDGIDAAAAWEPFRFNIRKSLGSDAIEFRDSTIYTGYSTITVQKKWAASHTRVVISFLKAIKKAEEFVKNNKDEAQQIIAKSIGLDISIVKATWNQYEMTLAFTEDLVNATTIIGEWIHTKDEYKDKSIPDYSIYYDNAYFKQLAK